MAGQTVVKTTPSPQASASEPAGSAQPLLQRLAHGVFWSVLGTVLSRGLTQLAMIGVARLLGKVPYGELGVIQSTLIMCEAFATFGMGITALKYVAELRHSDPPRAGRILVLAGSMSAATGVIMAVALFLLAPYLADNVLAAPHLTSLLRLASPLLVLSAINGAQTGALSGFEAFKTIATINISSAVVACPLLIGGVYFWHLDGAVGGLLVAAIINAIAGHWAIRTEAHRGGIPLVFQDIGREWKVVWNYSLPWLISSAMTGPVHWLCNAMLANQPNGYAELGLFHAAERWYPVVAFLPLVFARPLFPVLSQQMGANDRSGLVRTLLYYIGVNAAVVLPIVLVGSLCSRFIMEWYGPSFVDGQTTLIVMLLTAGLCVVQTPLGQAIAVLDRMWSALVVSLLWGGALVLASLWWLEWGAFGLASARLLAAGVYNVIGVLFVWLTLRYR